jgi:hypothetical protein
MFKSIHNPKERFSGFLFAKRGDHGYFQIDNATAHALFTKEAASLVGFENMHLGERFRFNLAPCKITGGLTAVRIRRELC